MPIAFKKPWISCAVASAPFGEPWCIIASAWVSNELPCDFQMALPSQPKPSAISVGYGGPVDWSSGRICNSFQIKGWDDFPLRDWLAKVSGLPVYVDNDANVAALGEARFGAGRGYDPVFYCTLGSGVGGGLILNRQIYHGAKPGESEIGHLRLDRAGTLIEDRCSGWAVDRRIRAEILQHPGSELARLISATPAQKEASHLVAALAFGDPLAQQILSETMDDLAFGLSHAVHLFHPEMVILGGGLSLIGEPLREALASALPRYLMAAFQPGPEIALAALREDAVPMGALALASDALALRAAAF